MKRVVLVDDVDLSIEMERSAFSRVECEIETARTGKEALSLVSKESPDLMVLDLFMPEMNGDECCRKMKSDPVLANIPVIMTTAGTDGTDSTLADKERCITAGCNDFITKPFRDAEFMKKVARFLDIKVRQYRRVPTFLEIYYHDEEKVYRGYVDDLSEGGLFIKSEKPLPIGSNLDIVFTLPDKSSFIETKGEVVRTVEKLIQYNTDVVKGMGIRFSNITQEMRDAIADYVWTLGHLEEGGLLKRKKMLFKRGEYKTLNDWLKFFGASFPERTLNLMCK